MTRALTALLFLAPALAVVACDRTDATPKPSASSEFAPAPPAPSLVPSSKPAASASASASADPFAALSTGAQVREEATVVVDGVPEKWRLEWAQPPALDCVDAAAFATCPCAAFAFGEKGELDLVRTRAGAPEERLHLAPLFAGGVARLRRWPVTKADTGKSPDVASLVMRPIEPVMKLVDSDHDGRATEMVLPTSSEPCGHSASVVVGISRSNPVLHVLTPTEKPD
ncbi:MAG: hypothetical protein ABSE49_01420 [Polyangiaceae bacterium]|jgi:hypothetical protein